LTTLSNITKKTSSIRPTTRRITTTTNENFPQTTSSQIPINETIQATTDTFEIETWTNTSIYETTFFTGQTVIKAYSEFIIEES
jgi:hypothetical protein